jgi:simple sugar transport system permease protein
VLLAALGGAICAKAGVFNVGLEGFMLAGAFAAVAGSWFSGSAWIGVIAAALAGAGMAACWPSPACATAATRSSSASP